MAQQQHLANAPITEALVDLRISAPTNLSVKRLNEALDRLDFGYRRTSPIIRGQFGFSLNPEETPPAVALAGPTAIIGVRLHSPDDRYIAQFTLEGFTLSRLPPYESWEHLIAEAKRLWHIYLECVQPAHITRVGTRFINNLRLPRTPEPVERFLTMLPVFPEGLPQTLYGFLEQFLIHDSERGATVILTQRLNYPIPEGSIPVILDVDVFRESSFDLHAADVWGCFDVLRVLKNKFFFSCLTEAAIDLYR